MNRLMTSDDWADLAKRLVDAADGDAAAVDVFFAAIAWGPLSSMDEEESK